MSPITVIFCLILINLVLALAVCGLLVLFLDRIDDIRQARTGRDQARAAEQQARRELRELYARHEALADEAAADRHLIQTFIPHSINEDLS